MDLLLEEGVIRPLLITGRHQGKLMTTAPDNNGGGRTRDRRGLALCLTTMDTKRMYFVTTYKDLESEVVNKQCLMS